jgi:hypothetical protein
MVFATTVVVQAAASHPCSTRPAARVSVATPVSRARVALPRVVVRPSTSRLLVGVAAAHPHRPDRVNAAADSATLRSKAAAEDTSAAWSCEPLVAERCLPMRGWRNTPTHAQSSRSTPQQHLLPEVTIVRLGSATLLPTCVRAIHQTCTALCIIDEPNGTEEVGR